MVLTTPESPAIKPQSGGFDPARPDRPVVSDTSPDNPPAESAMDKEKAERDLQKATRRLTNHKVRTLLKAAEVTWREWAFEDDDPADFNARRLARLTFGRLQMRQGVRAWPNRLLRDGLMDYLEDWFLWRYRVSKLIQPHAFPKDNFMGYYFD